MLTSLERSKGILNLLVKLIPLQPCKSDQQLVFIAAVLEKVIELALEMKCVDRDDEHHRETQDGRQSCPLALCVEVIPYI